jgi:hypothetical protein
MRTTFFGAALATSVVATLALARPAAAADGDPCAALTGEDNAVPTLYVENGDTQEPLVKKLGKLLMQSTNKLRIIYRNRPTCNIRNDMFSGAQMTTVADGTTPRPVRYIPADPAFNPSQDAPTCTVPDPPSAGQPIVLGIGATYLSSCAQTPAQPTTVGVLEGPTQAYGFVTNKASAQVAITAEEAYLAYGFTEGGGDANPWTVQNLRFKRGNTASTTLTMAAAMRLLPAQMKALSPDFGTSEAIVTATTGAVSNPDASLGILGMDLYDQHRNDQIKVLAFKTFGQKYAYFPDSTNASFDKQNVRDGHYVPWAPTPYISGVGADTSTFLDAKARRVYELVMGTRIGDDVDGIGQVVGSGLIPKCAMKVTRSGDGADLTLYSDPAPCGCYFEKTVPEGTTTCTACTDGNNAPCGTGVCRRGFCEAK